MDEYKCPRCGQPQYSAITLKLHIQHEHAPAWVRRNVRTNVPLVATKELSK